jgi:hypothetical protein
MAKTRSYLQDVKRRKRQARGRKTATELEDAMIMTDDPVMQGIGVSRALVRTKPLTKAERKAQKIIGEEIDKAKEKGLKEGIETDFYEDKVKKRIKKVKKGGLIKVRRGDGIAKRGKTKGRMI